MQTNTFSRDFYNKTKIEIIAELEGIYPNYDGKTQGFIVDGLRNPGEYEKQPLKIMAILGETYGYDNCGAWDIEKRPLTTDNLKVPTLTKIGALAWILLKSLEIGKELSMKDYPGLFRDHNKIENGLNKIAWVNVKKLSNGKSSKQKNDEIIIEAQRVKVVLKKQIISIVPDLILVCSDPVMKSVCDLDILEVKVASNQKFKIQNLPNGIKVMHVSHPSYYRHWSYVNFAKIYKTIWDSIKYE